MCKNIMKIKIGHLKESKRANINKLNESHKNSKRSNQPKDMSINVAYGLLVLSSMTFTTTIEQ